MKDINTLLQKYSKAYVPGEQRSREYNTKLKQQERQKNKENIAEQLFNEVPFHLTQDEKEHVRHLIHMYPNFRNLHGKASNETIILAFIFYVKMANKNIKIDRYTITEKYKLTHTTFEIIVCRLVKHHFLSSYILPRPTKDKQHDILCKGDAQ